MSELAPPCTTHPDAPAGWRCGTCGSALCAQCAAWRIAGQGRIEVCKLCRGAALPIRVRRALVHPFTVQTLIGAVRWPFHKEGFLTSVACALVLALIAHGALGVLFAFGIVLATLFHVTTSTAHGEDEFSSSGDFRGFFSDVLEPIFRLLTASVWAWAPIAVYTVWRGGFMREANLSNPSGMEATFLALSLVAGAFLFPMALLAGALGVPLQHLLNPLAVVGYAVKLGRDYVRVSVFCLAVLICEWLLFPVIDLIDRLVWLPSFVRYTALLYPPLMLFRAMGMLVRTHGDELNYGGKEAYLVPVLGDRLPDEQLSAPQEVPLEFPESVSVEPGAAAEIELPLESDAMPPALALARRVTENDVEGAVELLQRAGKDVPAAALSAKAWIDLSKACLERGHSALAILPLRRAVEIAPEGPLAPQAWLQAARIYDEKLGNRALSDQLLAELIKRHPASAEAQFASKRLQGS
jgi:hypothetical protein